MRRLCILLLAVAGACSSGGGPRKLDDIALTAKEATRAAGEEVSLTTGPGSRLLRGDAGKTLDQCAPSYPSEALRVERYQVGYVNASTRLSASNEVVRYKPGGASQSYRELSAAVQHCALQGLTAQFELAPHDGALLDRQVAFSTRVLRRDAVVFQAAVYQYHGDVLDAVYAFRPQRADALAAASKLARAAERKLSP